MYHFYYWGFSSIYVSTCYLFQHSQYETLLKLALDIGYHSCWFYNASGYGILIFFEIPVYTMLTVNLILFLLTAIHCSRIKSELKKFNPSDSKTESFLVYKEKFVLSLKLFLVMGMIYTFWMLLNLFGGYRIMKTFFTITSILQEVFVFIIFGANRKVIMELRKKFRGSMDYSEVTQINTISGSL